MENEATSGEKTENCQSSTSSKRNSKESVVKDKDKGSVRIKTDSSSDQGSDGGISSTSAHPKVPHKIIANWKHACDRTRDRTRDLLKRWRTLPEFEGVHNADNVPTPLQKTDSQTECSGWSVHVWTTWVDRFSVDTMDQMYPGGYICELTVTQTNKFSHFFTHLLDHNRDDLITNEDIETFIERLRHFADWSTNSPEYNILREVERGFMETFLKDIPDDEKLGFELNRVTYLTRDGWLFKWAQLVTGSRNLSDFPIWLQYFNKVLFQVINKSGCGVISQEELRAFYSSVLCLDSTAVDDLIDEAYQAMTSKGDHSLTFSVYRLCFANYLLGRYPNGPGLHILGGLAVAVAAPSARRHPDVAFNVNRFNRHTLPFPVDYSALNAQPEDLERYTGESLDSRGRGRGVGRSSTASYPEPAPARHHSQLYTAAERQHCRRSVIV